MDERLAELMRPKRPPLALDSIVTFGDDVWKISAVGMTGGERYYWLTNTDGDVAMYPAGVVERG